MQHVDVIIIGGGPAGISAAMWCKRLEVDHLLLEKKEELGGQFSKIYNEIIDYPGLYAKDGKEMQRMFVEQLDRAGCSYRLRTNILSINHSLQTIKIQQKNKIEEIHFNYLVLATGTEQRKLDVPGEKEMIARGEIYSATADRYLFTNKVVAVVGGGDRAFEGAILLAEAGATVYLIHRSKYFKARAQYTNIAFQKENVKIMTDTEVTAIYGDGRVTSIDLINTCLDKAFSLEVDAVLVRIGTKPNVDLIKEYIEINEQGFVIVDGTGKTSNDSIYAIGDICTKPLFSSIVSSVGQGAVAAKHISLSLTSNDEHVTLP